MYGTCLGKHTTTVTVHTTLLISSLKVVTSYIDKEDNKKLMWARSMKGKGSIDIRPCSGRHAGMGQEQLVKKQLMLLGICSFNFNWSTPKMVKVCEVNCEHHLEDWVPKSSFLSMVQFSHHPSHCQPHTTETTQNIVGWAWAGRPSYYEIGLPLQSAWECLSSRESRPALSLFFHLCSTTDPFSLFSIIHSLLLFVPQTPKCIWCIWTQSSLNWPAWFSPKIFSPCTMII